MSKPVYKICSICNKRKTIGSFYWDKYWSRYLSDCKSCTAGRVKKYTATEEGKKSVNKASKKSYENHREKWIARAKARYAIQKGLIIKPKKCEVCEQVKTLQGHHEDYTKPLEVIFLCYQCHAEADRELESRTALLSTQE